MSKENREKMMSEISTKADNIISQLPAFSLRYFWHLKDENSSPRTLLQYAYALRRFFNFIAALPCMKEVDIQTAEASDVMDRLQIDDIQMFSRTLDYYHTTDSKGHTTAHVYSPSGKAAIMCSIRSFYRYMFTIRQINNNLADIIDIPSVPAHKKNVLTKDQVHRLIEAVSDYTGMNNREIALRKKVEKRDLAIIMLLLGTGIRISELIGIDMKDIDIYNASILVTRKGGREDFVYFSSEVENALQDYIYNGRDTLEPDESCMNALFISNQHKRLSVRSVQKLLEKYSEIAGLNINVTPHTCRRTFGTHIYEQTRDVYLTQQVLGHESVETTSKHYVVSSPTHDVADTAAKIFQRENTKLKN